MSKLDEFLSKIEDKPEAKPAGFEWFASVRCQHCNEDVDEQTLYPAEHLLIWTCSQGHRSFIEGYSAF